MSIHSSGTQASRLPAVCLEMVGHGVVKFVRVPARQSEDLQLSLSTCVVADSEELTLWDVSGCCSEGELVEGDGIVQIVLQQVRRRVYRPGQGVRMDPRKDIPMLQRQGVSF